jgi:RNA polymerase sigma-70 factor (ECF subfamily)
MSISPLLVRRMNRKRRRPSKSSLSFPWLSSLLQLYPSPVVALNHAAAVAMGTGLEQGLLLIEQLEATGELDGYHLLPAAKADVLRRLGRNAEAAAAYGSALSLVSHPAERRYLEHRRKGLVAE